MDTEAKPTTLDEQVADVMAPITEALARNHEFAPAHVHGVDTEVVDADKEITLEVPKPRAASRGDGVDLGEFGLTVFNALKNAVTGYILQVRQNGTLVHVGIWNWARTPADQGSGWDEDTRMHVASVSKTLTAIGLMKLLKAKNISLDAEIISYLPTYWSKGSNIDKITFRHLLKHQSGFSTGSSATDFATMKARVAAGVPGVGASDYENMNFGLCRILMSVINGDIGKGTVFGFLNDQMWDLTTIGAYRKYMQANVFTPAGVTNASFAPVSGGKNALAYKFPHGGQKGWNSGDLSTVSGGAGWRLSVKELLNVMNHARRKNTILDAATMQALLAGGLGIDQIIPTPAGTLYNKNGAWGTASGTEQCVAYFWPNDMEMALYVNSPIGALPGASLRNLVKDAFVSSL